MMYQVVKVTCYELHCFVAAATSVDAYRMMVLESCITGPSALRLVGDCRRDFSNIRKVDHSESE